MYEPFASTVVSSVARVPPGDAASPVASVCTWSGWASGQYVSVPDVSVMSFDSTIGTRSMIVDWCRGDAIQPCVSSGPPVGGSFQVSGTIAEFTWNVGANAVAWI